MYKCYNPIHRHKKTDAADYNPHASTTTGMRN